MSDIYSKRNAEKLLLNYFKIFESKYSDSQIILF